MQRQCPRRWWCDLGPWHVHELIPAQHPQTQKLEAAWLVCYSTKQLIQTEDGSRRTISHIRTDLPVLPPRAEMRAPQVTDPRRDRSCSLVQFGAEPQEQGEGHTVHVCGTQPLAAGGTLAECPKKSPTPGPQPHAPVSAILAHTKLSPQNLCLPGISSNPEQLTRSSLTGPHSSQLKPLEHLHQHKEACSGP